MRCTKALNQTLHISSFKQKNKSRKIDWKDSKDQTMVSLNLNGRQENETVESPLYKLKYLHSEQISPKVK